MAPVAASDPHETGENPGLRHSLIDLITPIVQQQTVKLPPALSILAVVLLGVLFGPLGLVLAAPLAAVVLVRMLYIEEVLGDREHHKESRPPQSSISPESQPAPPNDGAAPRAL